VGVELTPILILLAIGAVVVVAYLAAWRLSGKHGKQIGAAVLSAIAGAAALVAFSYAVSGLRDFFDHGIPRWQILLAECVMFAIAAGLGWFALRLLMHEK